jgi:hypothetical protein
MRVEAGFQKKAPGRDNSEQTENQHRRSAPGKIGDVSQIMRFLSKRVGYDLSETFKVSEWQFDLALLSPGAGRRNGRISHIWQRKDGSASKVHAGRCNPGHNDAKQDESEPFSFG